MFKKLFMPALILLTLSFFATHGYAAKIGDDDSKRMQKMSESFTEDLEDISEDIAELQTLVNEKTPKMSAADQRKFKTEITAIKQKENDLRDNLSSLKNKSSDGDWKKTKTELKASVDDLEDRIKQTKKHVRKAY